MSAPVIDVSKLIELTNRKGAVIDTQNSNLTFSKAKVVNDGSINARDYRFKGGSFAQNGTIKGKSLRTAEGTAMTNNGKTELSGALQAHSFTPFSIYGEIKAHELSSFGPIDLYGNLTVVDSFYGNGFIHNGAKLVGNSLCFGDVLVDGELFADSLYGKSNFTINQGKVFVKTDAVFNGLLKVAEQGFLRGYKKHVLNLFCNGGAEIAGLVDGDNLNAEKPINVTGKLNSRKKTLLKANLHAGAKAEVTLANLRFNKNGFVTNYGILRIIGLEKGWFSLTNSGNAQIDAGQNKPTWKIKPISKAIKGTEASPKAINLWFSNSGQLTLKNGEFDLSDYAAEHINAFDNEGTFEQDNAIIWFDKPKNTGTWKSPQELILENYDGTPLGDLQATLKVYADGLDVLDGLKDSNTKQVSLYTLTINNTIKRSYPWPLQMHIEEDMDNRAEIRAPGLYIYGRNLKTTGNLIADKGSLDLTASDTIEINAQVGGKYGVWIFSDFLKILGKGNKPGSEAPNLIYQRNGNGIYSDGHIHLWITDLIENNYGIIKGERYDIRVQKLINRAGLIKATNFNSQIEVKELQNIRDDEGRQPVLGCRGFNVCGYSTATGGGRDDPGNWLSTPGCYCAGKTAPYETSEEGVIISQGNLVVTYEYLKMIASRITCGDDLTLKANVNLENLNDLIRQWQDLANNPRSAGKINNLATKELVKIYNKAAGKIPLEEVTSTANQLLQKYQNVQGLQKIEDLFERINQAARIKGAQTKANQLDIPEIAKYGNEPVNLILPKLQAELKAAKSKFIYKNGDMSLNTEMVDRNSHNCYIIVKNDLNGNLGNTDITTTINANNLFLEALAATIRNPGQVNQAAQIFNFSEQPDILGSPFDDKNEKPQNAVIVVVGDVKDKIIIQKAYQNLKQTIINHYDTICRSIDGLGLNPEQFMKHIFSGKIAEYVRGLKDTKSRMLPITFGDQTTQVEVLTNPQFTKQNALDLRTMAAFIEVYVQNVNRLEDEERANANVIGIFPDDNPEGINLRGNGLIKITEGDLNLGVSMRAENGCLIAEQGSVKIYSMKIRHQNGDNYTEILHRTTLAMKKSLGIYGYKDIVFEAATTESIGITNIESKTGAIIDKALATVNYNVHHTSDGDSHTTTKITDIHQNVDEHHGEKVIMTTSQGLRMKIKVSDIF